MKCLTDRLIMPSKDSELVIPHPCIQCKAVNQDQRMTGASPLIIQVGAIGRKHACNLFHWFSSSRFIMHPFRSTVRRDQSDDPLDGGCSSASCLRGLR